MIIPNQHNRCFLPVGYHWYAAASLPHVSLTSSLSSSIRLSSHDFLTHFCYGYIAMILITIKLYSTKSFGINIRLLTYRGITIIPSYRPALGIAVLNVSAIEHMHAQMQGSNSEHVQVGTRYCLNKLIEFLRLLLRQ